MPEKILLPNRLRLLTTLACWAILGGCASSATLPRDLPSMETIYEQHQSGDGGLDAEARPDRALREVRQTTAAPLYNEAADLKGYTRTAYNEIDNLFAQLPNPTIVLFIDPHLTDAGYPVPGYSTALTLYERAQFALPGEVPPPSRPVGVTEPGE